jgi:hypothetical protein
VGEKRNTKTEQAAGGKRVSEMAQHIYRIEFMGIGFVHVQIFET